MLTAKIGATAKGGICRLDADRTRSRGARLVQGTGASARLRGRRRRHGQHVRTARGPACRHSAHRHRQPSRHPADRRQVRRCARRARRAGGIAHLASRRLRDVRAHRSRQLDQRGRRPLRAADDRLRRVCRGLQPRLGLRPRRPRRRNLRRRARQDRLSRHAALRRPQAVGFLRSCTSSRAPISRPRAKTSASSPACRRCAGTK